MEKNMLGVQQEIRYIKISDFITISQVIDFLR